MPRVRYALYFMFSRRSMMFVSEKGTTEDFQDHCTPTSAYMGLSFVALNLNPIINLQKGTPVSRAGRATT